MWFKFYSFFRNFTGSKLNAASARAFYEHTVGCSVSETEFLNWCKVNEDKNVIIDNGEWCGDTKDYRHECTIAGETFTLKADGWVLKNGNIEKDFFEYDNLYWEDEM